MSAKIRLALPVVAFLLCLGLANILKHVFMTRVPHDTLWELSAWSGIALSILSIGCLVWFGLVIRHETKVFEIGNKLNLLFNSYSHGVLRKSYNVPLSLIEQVQEAKATPATREQLLAIKAWVRANPMQAELWRDECDAHYASL